MRGDFSRLTFRPQNHYSGVRLQQGRVQLDSEFNEHVDIEAHRDRETARDVIGPAGVPQDGGGFAVAIAVMLRGLAATPDLWAVGDDGTVLHAAAGAAAWTLAARPAGSGRLNDVHFATKDVGWAVGDGAKLYRLGADTAAAVEKVPTGLTADLHGVHATGPEAAWAVGAGGTVLALGGGEWKPQASQVTAALRAVHFAGNSGMAVGDRGTVIATADGKQWTAQAAPPGTGDLHGVFVLDAEHRWAVGEQGTVLFFDGTTWAPQSVPVTATLRAVTFRNADEGTAVGDSGTIVSTDDGGATWSDVSLEATADLHDVVAAPDGPLIAVGDGVTVTAHGRSGWRQEPAPPADGDQAPVGRTLTLSAGDIYVGGVRCENERVVSLSAQPEPPLSGRSRGPLTAGTYGVYVQVQEQHLTAVERESLREVALGGPDSATRTRIVWQADLVPIDDEQPGCADVTAAVRRNPPGGRLRARAKPAAVSSSDCIVPPSGGYERLENQLYRVEIHGPSATGDGMTFKWSRDNASVIARLLRIETKPGTGGAEPTGAVKVSDVGRDATLGFAPDQVVEITDEGRLLRGQPGVLAEIGQIDGDTLLLENVEQEPLTMADFPDGPIVRRWDGRADVKPNAAEHDPATGLFERKLEAGVFVAFADGPDPADSFRTGDYWTIPARTLSGAVEWPSTGGVPSFEERHGPELRLAPLALVEVDEQGRWSSVRDCRKLFPPLTELVHLYYVGGDGQEEMPTTLPLSEAAFVGLDRPLEVGVANGRRPLVGATVEFEIKQGTGRLHGSDGSVGTPVAVLTGPEGIAACPWELDGKTPAQRVEARLRDPLGQSPPQVVRFGARLSIAEEVAYDGTACDRLADSPTVQKAIDALSRLTRIFPLTGSGEDLLPGQDVEIEVLVADQCGPVDGATVQFTPDGGGTVTGAQPNTDGGIARCRWQPDTTTPTQHLVASLQSIPSGVIHQPAETRFTVNLNLARDTQYTPPRDCPELDGVETVQDAIDRLMTRLPRLYHVSGDGLDGALGEKLVLRVGVANRCGASKPRVRFETTDDAPRARDAWRELGTVEPDADGIAAFEYEVTGEPRQVVRAGLLGPRSDRPLGDPVYFNVSLAGAAEEGFSPAARLEVRQSGQIVGPSDATLVDFAAGGTRFDIGGMHDPREPSHLRAPRPGTYLATAELSWDDQARVTPGFRTLLELQHRGEPIGRASSLGVPVGALVRQVMAQQVTAITRMETNDTVQLQVAQDSTGGPLQIDAAILALAWMGP